jgi:hypothetical protein
LSEHVSLEQSDLAVVDVEKLQHHSVRGDSFHQRLNLGFVLHLIKSSRKSLVDFVLLLRGESLDVLGQIEVPSHVNSLKLIIAWGSHDDLSHPLLEFFQHNGYCLPLFSSFVHLNKGFTHFVWSAIFNHNFRSKLVSLEIF